MARTKRRSDAPAADPMRVRWWTASAKDEREVASCAWGWIDNLRQRTRTENAIDLIHEAIYEGRPLGSQTNGLESATLNHLRQQKSAPANLNITRSMVDTVTSRLSKRRPMPAITAEDAGWTEKLFGKRASRILRRKLGHATVERMKPLIIRDAAIRGTGVAKVIRNGGDVSVERVPRHEIVIDPREARYGTPRTIAQVKAYPKDVLKAEYPDLAVEIEAAATLQSEGWSPDDYDAPNDTDHVEVGELFHLPSSPGAKDGRHVITIRGQTLLDEKWTRMRHPYACLHWSPPVRGFWGHGLVEDLTGIQAKVNDIARDIQEALYFGAMLKIFQARSSNVDKHHLRARHPVVIEYDGTPPQFVAPNPVSVQQIQFLEWLINKAYEISGISQLSASSKNPLGSNASGKAIDTMYDIESDRFSTVEIAQATWVCDLGQLLVDEAQALAADAADPKCREISRKDLAPWIREIDWKKVRIDEGEYHLTIEAINFLPESRAGKLSALAELGKAGLITDPVVMLAQFEEPDMQRMFRTELGPYYNLLRVMEGVAEPSVPFIEVQPDPHMDLKRGIRMAIAEYNDAMSEPNCPEEILERFRKWLSLAEPMEKKSRAAKEAANSNIGAGSAGAMPPGMPPPMNGNGMPPPGMMPAPGMAA
jgi:hypothetical protein